MRLKAIPANFAPVYLCPTCGAGYAKQELAKACFESDEAAEFKVGDIVCVAIGYHWFDGDEKWVIDRLGYKSHGDSSYRFWFVITAITQKEPAFPFRGNSDAHRLKYHVQTLALKNGNPVGFSGWNHPDTHRGMYRPEGIEPPPEVVEAAKALVGQTFERLL